MTTNKAPLFSVEWSWRYFYFAKFRLANAVRIQIGWLTIHTRAPWLEQAKQFHEIRGQALNPGITGHRDNPASNGIRSPRN